jgi:dihydroorotate dehydrogenase electron transfer subunit
MDDIRGTVAGNQMLCAAHGALTVRLEKPMDPVTAGQFVMVRLPSADVFLRRPFSIADATPKTITIMYKVVGKGTGVVHSLKRGAPVMVLGPLGNGFSVEKGRTGVVVAGGIGIAGVHLLVRRHRGPLKVFYGCATATEAALLGDMRDRGPLVATLDGSLGFRGTVVDLLSRHLDGLRTTDPAIFACGPKAMLVSLQGLLGKNPLPCQVAVEERMACGLGLCFGCAVATRDETEPYKRACKEGPVFDLWQLSL